MRTSGGWERLSSHWSEPLDKGDPILSVPTPQLISRSGQRARPANPTSSPSSQSELTNTQASDKGPKCRLYLDPLPHPEPGEKLRNHHLRSNAHFYPVPQSQPLPTTFTRSSRTMCSCTINYECLYMDSFLLNLFTENTTINGMPIPPVTKKR